MKKLFESKLFKIAVVAFGIIIFSALLAVVLIKLNVFQEKPAGYSVVYLSTGDIYFGELSRFPYLVLKNGYILQRGQDDGINLLPISSTVWEPAGGMRLNKDAVVFTAPLAKTSAVYRMIISQQQGGAVQNSPAPQTSVEPSPVLSPAE